MAIIFSVKNIRHMRHSPQKQGPPRLRGALHISLTKPRIAQGTATIAIPRGMLPVAADPLATAVSLPVVLFTL